MKRLLKLIFVLASLMAVAYVIGRYRLVHTEQGFHVLEKSTWSVDDLYVDTRDWSLKEYFRNKELSQQLADLEWQQIRDSTARHWDQLAQRFGFQDHSAEQFLALREEAQRRFETWKAKLERGDINGERFMLELEKLEQWVEAEIEKLDR